MRFRAGHLACLLLLLSSLAVSGVRAGGVKSARTPGDVFVRNMLLRAAAEKAESTSSDFGRNSPVISAVVLASTLNLADGAVRPVTYTAHVHAVTGSSL